MEAGRELDALIAEKVFGAKLIRSEFEEGNPVVACDFPDRAVGQAFWSLPKYSTDIAHAWEVRLRMKELGWESEDRLTWMGWSTDQTKMGYSFWFWRWVDHEKQTFHAHVPDPNLAPHAICLAALAALPKESP